MQSLHIVQDGKPSFHARDIIPHHWGNILLDDISREQNAVFLDEDQLVSKGVGRSQPQQTGRHAAEIEFRFAVEEDIRRPKPNVLKQLFVLG